MDGKELEDELYLTFVDGGDGIYVEHKSIILDSAFIIAFDTGQEDESGDITKPEFMDIWKRVEGLRQFYDDVSIDVTISTPRIFHESLPEDDVSGEDFANSLGLDYHSEDVSDDYWHHAFYIFVMFRSRR